MFRVAALLVLLLGGCRADALDAMSKNTALVAEQFAAQYEGALEGCYEDAATREEYDACTAEWHAAADAVTALVNVTRTLDVAQGRRAFKGAGCAWLQALVVVDAVAPLPLPAVDVGLSSRWGRRC